MTNVYEIIAILCLENELTTQELNYINEFRSVTFAKNRNIKNLIVDFKLLPKEEIWYTYEIIGLVELENDVQNIISKNTQVYLSSQRMIVAKQGNITLSLDYNQIKTLKPSLNKLCQVLNIEQKGDIDGSKVWQAVQDGRIDEVAEYCSKDVERVRAIYKRMNFEV